MSHCSPAMPKCARLRVLLVGLAALLSVALLPGEAAAASPAKACEERANNTYEKLLGCVTLEGVREHQEAFQAIADANDDPFYPGTRAAGTEGYGESVEYVAGLLEDAGYEVTLDPVQITFNFPAVLRQLTPVARDVRDGRVHGQWIRHRPGTGDPCRHQPHAHRGPRPSGCEASDFAGIDWSGPADIALVQRGTCFFGTKAHNAELAGAEAVIIFNQGNTPDREALIVADATSLDPDGSFIEHGIPVVGASFADGVALVAAGVDRLRRGAAGRDPDGLQRDRRTAGQERRQRRDGRCPSRQRDRGAGDPRTTAPARPRSWRRP